MGRPKISRRSVLRAGSLGVVGSLAGCSAATVFHGSGVSLGDILIKHDPSTTHKLRLKLERDGEVVERVRYDLDGTQKKVVKATWSSDPVVYHLYTAIEGPLANDESFDLFENKFAKRDGASDSGCSVIDIQIGAPPTRVRWRSDSNRPVRGDSVGAEPLTESSLDRTGRTPLRTPDPNRRHDTPPRSSGRDASHSP